MPHTFASNLVFTLHTVDTFHLFDCCIDLKIIDNTRINVNVVFIITNTFLSICFTIVHTLNALYIIVCYNIYIYQVNIILLKQH